MWGALRGAAKFSVCTGWADGGARGAVSLCAPHSPAQAVAHSFVRSGSHGPLELGARGGGGGGGGGGGARAAQAAVSTAAQRRVCDLRRTREKWAMSFLFRPGMHAAPSHLVVTLISSLSASCALLGLRSNLDAGVTPGKGPNLLDRTLLAGVGSAPSSVVVL